MTEAEWRTCEDPDAMLPALGRACSERKIRLFCCACCRLFPSGVAAQIGASAAIAGEASADGHPAREEYARAVANIRAAHRSNDGKPMWHYLGHLAFHAIDRSHPWGILVALSARDTAQHSIRQGQRVDASALEQLATAQPDLLRDIFGNPFRPVIFPPTWRTDTAVSLARQMYEAREFGAMPILADALQDAGCDNEDVLNHCRAGQEGVRGNPRGVPPSEGAHVRGCWVVDRVLEQV